MPPFRGRSASSRICRDTDTTIRYGGEELIVISVGGMTEGIGERLEGFRRQIEQSVVTVDDKQSSLTLSIGLWSGVPAVKTKRLSYSNSPMLRCMRQKETGEIDSCLRAKRRRP